MPVSDAQVRKLMKEFSKDGRLGHAAMKAGMDRKTARKYLKVGKLPSEMTKERTWRTRPDPFAEDWVAIAERLEDAPELEAKALFEELLSHNPEGYIPGQLRTFQRRVRQWRAQHGPDKRVFFAQVHRAGEAMQTDFTWTNELGLTLQGEPFMPLLCHSVLPYSNWQSAVVCRSESLAALRCGVQRALLKLGSRPAFHQTDNSTSATHSLSTGKTAFNESYLALMRHWSMTPRTIAVGAKEQNGDVEALNGALKRRLAQHLALRGSKDFDSAAEFEAWLWDVLDRANALRVDKLREELAVMQPIEVQPLPEYTVETPGVTSWSTIRVKHNTYSVPSRLIGEKVHVRLYEDRLEVYYGGQHQLTVERLVGRNGHRVNYRHIIWSLVRRPGAFARYRYREDLFPTTTFRRAYDALCAAKSPRVADIAYLRVLFLAATTFESEVELALELLLDEGVAPEPERVKALVVIEPPPDVPDLDVPDVDLASYDALLQEVGA